MIFTKVPFHLQRTITDALELYEKQSNKAYITDIYLLRAFAYLQTKEYLLAKNDCNSVEDEIEVFVQGFGFIHKKELLRSATHCTPI